MFPATLYLPKTEILQYFKVTIWLLEAYDISINAEIYF